MEKETWFEEKYKDILGNRYRVEKILFEGKSPYQKVEVFETRGHGRMLVNDGFIMTSDKDEFIYHDMISHVPLFVHLNPKNILEIGMFTGYSAISMARGLPDDGELIACEIDDEAAAIAEKNILSAGLEKKIKIIDE